MYRTDVVAPPLFPLTKSRLYDNATTGLPNIQVLRDHLIREGRLTHECAATLIEQASTILHSEPNLLELKYPITVCGDIHGQYFDLIRLFEVGGDPSTTQYLFLGDYVDRGCFSTEVVFYLYALKLVYPNSFYMLRGNHECRQLTAFFNFKDECLYKYSIELYDIIMSSFDNLPLAALVNKSFFCVHGGLSPEISTLDDIRAMDRYMEIPREGPMCDLLWSDPFEEDGDHKPNPDATPDATPAIKGNKAAAESIISDKDGTVNLNWFGYNDTRQCSYVYGVEAVKAFLKDNKLTSLIRAHEAQIDGYKMQMINKSSGIPRVITIFSAPNYCDVYKNKAACLKFDNNVLNIKQFVDSPHPYYLPNFMDVFQWSLPFVAEKVTDMLANVLEFNNNDNNAGNQSSDDELMSNTDRQSRETVVEKRGGLLKKKVMAVSKLLRTYKILRQEHEALVQLKQLLPSHKVPAGLLSGGAEGIQRAISGFEQAKAADITNEKMPNSPSIQNRKIEVKPAKFRINTNTDNTTNHTVPFEPASPPPALPAKNIVISISNKTVGTANSTNRSNSNNTSPRVVSRSTAPAKK